MGRGCVEEATLVWGWGYAVPTLIDLDMQDRGCGLPRIPLPRTRVNRDLLAYLLVLRSRLWVQPQGDVLGLHGVPGHPYEVLAQRIQVRLLSQSAGKSG